MPRSDPFPMAIHQGIQVGGVPAEARPAEPHRGACHNFGGSCISLVSGDNARPEEHV